MTLTLRAATTDDATRLYRWRNDPVTRQMFRSTGLVEWHDHVRWLDKTLHDSDRMLLVAESSGEPCAVIRFDRLSTTGSAEVSVNVSPDFRGRGVGTETIRAGTAHALTVYTVVQARVKAENEASIHAFTAAGYARVAATTDEVVLVAERRLNAERKEG